LEGESDASDDVLVLMIGDDRFVIVLAVRDDVEFLVEEDVIVFRAMVDGTVVVADAMVGDDVIVFRAMVGDGTVVVIDAMIGDDVVAVVGDNVLVVVLFT
jgi:carbonic anhydrase/acetyltransferase-like protein (isoleucine patch superfamily)